MLSKQRLVLFKGTTRQSDGTVSRLVWIGRKPALLRKPQPFDCLRPGRKRDKRGCVTRRIDSEVVLAPVENNAGWGSVRRSR